MMIAAQQISHAWSKPRAQRVPAASRMFSRGHMKLAQTCPDGKPPVYTPRRAGQLTSPALRQTLALWQDSAPDASRPPAAGAFDILDYRQVIGCLNLIEVREPPLDFVFRVHSVLGSDYIGQDMTGRSVWDYPDARYGGFVREVCRRATLEQRAQVVIEDVLVRRRQTSYDCPYRWEALLLPLCGPDGGPAVTRLIFAFDLHRLERDS
jgi:hypothetical protein